MQSEPEWFNWDLYLELHYIGATLDCICIGIRWQIQIFNSDMINSALIWWPFLRQHHLIGERDDKFDCWRVNSTNRRSYRVVIYSGKIIVGEEFEREGLVFGLGINANIRSTFVIRNIQKLKHFIVLVLLWSEPELFKLFGISLSFIILVFSIFLVKHLRVSVKLLKCIT